MLISVGGFSDDPEGKSIEFLKNDGFWRPGPNLPYQVSFASAVVIGQEVFVLGGEYVGQDGISDSIFSLKCSPEMSTWKVVGKLKFARYQHASVAIDRNIWTFGGSIFNYGTTRLPVEIFNIRYLNKTIEDILFKERNGLSAMPCC